MFLQTDEQGCCDAYNHSTYNINNNDKNKSPNSAQTTH